MDTIANMFSTIKNAQALSRDVVELDYSKMREAIAHLMKDEGYLSEVKVFKPKGEKFKKLALGLTYYKDRPFIGHLKRISKPGQRIYVGKEEIPLALGGRGLIIMSTPRGIMSGREARKKNLGGEVVCEMW